MNRRGFLQACLAAGVAPAFIPIGRLMVPKAREIIQPVIKTYNWLEYPDPVNPGKIIIVPRDYETLAAAITENIRGTIILTAENTFRRISYGQ